MFENALRSPISMWSKVLSIDSKTTQCNSWINSWHWSANWQVRRSGVPDRYHHGKAASSLVDDCQTMHPPPAELIRKQDRSACDSGFHTHTLAPTGATSAFINELATIRKFGNCNENSGTFQFSFEIRKTLIQNPLDWNWLITFDDHRVWKGWKGQLEQMQGKVQTVDWTYWSWSTEDMFECSFDGVHKWGCIAALFSNHAPKKRTILHDELRESICGIPSKISSAQQG